MLKIGQVWGFKKDIGDPWAEDGSHTWAVITDMKDGWVRYRYWNGTKFMSVKQEAFTDTYDHLIKEAPDADQS